MYKRRLTAVFGALAAVGTAFTSLFAYEAAAESRQTVQSSQYSAYCFVAEETGQKAKVLTKHLSSRGPSSAR